MDAVVYDQITVRSVVKQSFDDFPEAARGEFLAAQVVADCVVTGSRLAFEMIGKVSAGVVVGRGD